MKKVRVRSDYCLQSSSKIQATFRNLDQKDWRTVTETGADKRANTMRYEDVTGSTVLTKGLSRWWDILADTETIFCKSVQFYVMVSHHGTFLINDRSNDASSIQKLDIVHLYTEKCA